MRFHHNALQLRLIIAAKMKPNALLENDAHVHFFMELPICMVLQFI